MVYTQLYHNYNFHSFIFRAIIMKHNITKNIVNAIHCSFTCWNFNDANFYFVFLQTEIRSHGQGLRGCAHPGGCVSAYCENVVLVT